MTPGKQILLVESDPVDRASLAVVLGRMGHTVRCAASCAEALDELRTRRPHLILLDLRTAGQDGGGFCRRHRQDPALKDVPLVVVSAPGRTDQEEDLPGDVTYFPKPIDREKLLAALGRTLEGGEAGPSLGGGGG